MRTVDIRVGHDNDFVVTQFFDIEFVAAYTAPQGGNQRPDFDRRQHLVKTSFFHIQNLALQRQDRLGPAIAPLFRRSARGITLDQEYFRQRRILFLAIGQLAGETGDVQHALASSHFPGLSRGIPGPCRVDNLADYRLGLLRVFLQIILQHFARYRLHDSLDLRRDQFVLGL